MGEIYCLYSPRDGSPRYVGQTAQQGRDRWNHHMARALRNEPGALYDWIRSLFAEKLDPEFHVLQESVIPADLDFYENYWIAQFADLINVRGSTPPLATTEVGKTVEAVIRGKIAARSKGGF